MENAMLRKYFYHFFIMSKAESNVALLYTDTDFPILYVWTENVYYERTS